MIVLGIDPGATGAVVVLEVKDDFRLTGAFRVVDWDRCFPDGLLSSDILTEFERKNSIVFAFIEEQKPFAKGGRQMGAKSAFALGENFGFWRGAMGQYANVEVVPVHAWQRYHFGSGTTISDPKVRSMRAAAQKWPDFPVDGKHGRADALLIALYGVAWVKAKKKGGVGNVGRNDGS